MAKGAALGGAAYRAGLGCGAGGIYPAVAESTALGGATYGAGLGCGTGCIYPAVAKGTAFRCTAYRAGLGCGTGCINPAVAKPAALDGADNDPVIGIMGSCFVCTQPAVRLGGCLDGQAGIHSQSTINCTPSRIVRFIGTLDGQVAAGDGSIVCIDSFIHCSNPEIAAGNSNGTAAVGSNPLVHTLNSNAAILNSNAGFTVDAAVQTLDLQNTLLDGNSPVAGVQTIPVGVEDKDPVLDDKLVICFHTAVTAVNDEAATLDGDILITIQADTGVRSRNVEAAVFNDHISPCNNAVSGIHGIGTVLHGKRSDGTKACAIGVGSGGGPSNAKGSIFCCIQNQIATGENARTFIVRTTAGLAIQNIGAFQLNGQIAFVENSCECIAVVGKTDAAIGIVMEGQNAGSVMGITACGLGSGGRGCPNSQILALCHTNAAHKDFGRSDARLGDHDPVVGATVCFHVGVQTGKCVGGRLNLQCRIHHQTANIKRRTAAVTECCGGSYRNKAAAAYGNRACGKNAVSCVLNFHIDIFEGNIALRNNTFVSIRPEIQGGILDNNAAVFGLDGFHIGHNAKICILNGEITAALNMDAIVVAIAVVGGINGDIAALDSNRRGRENTLLSHYHGQGCILGGGFNGQVPQRNNTAPAIILNVCSIPD